MLNSITITNFRKHTDTKLTFGEGLSVVRGANEIGKTTVTESIAYALFGVKAIRTPLEDAVTYGEPVNSLKVVLQITVDGVAYVVSRGKPGAQVDYAGGTVTGQSEVTAFMASKLKVDAAAAAKLMMAAQTEIRGALESGPKATTELIERLSEFDQLDHLVDLMQVKLTLGNTAPAQAAVESAQERLDRAVMAVEPDVAAMTETVEKCKGAADTARGAAEKAQETFNAAQAALAEAQAAKREREGAVSDLARRDAALETAKSDLKVLLESPVEVPDNVDARIESAQKAKSELAEQAKVRRIHASVKDLCGMQNVEYFKGTSAELQARIDEIRRNDGFSAKQVSEHRVAIATLKGQLNLDTCSFCGKDFSELPQVRAKNAATNAAIAQHAAKIAKLEELQEARAEESARLDAIMRSAAPYQKAMLAGGEHLSVNADTVPPVLTWVTELHEAGDQPDYDAEIARLRKQVKDAQAWQQSVTSLEDKAKTLEEFVVELTKRVQGLPEADTTAAEGALRTAKDKLADFRDKLEVALTKLTVAKATLKDEQRAWERACTERESAESALKTAADTVKLMEFNNTLLKKVRAARPVIADKLWNLVLAAVSNYFSEMRGFKSRVTKESDGFKADGHPVATLSGSTLDILGLAIRVALVRTFLPAAPFLILDEPMAGCDQQRTEAMLGFLQSVGFKQVVLITHEDVSESVADHIINIGE